MDRYIRYLQTGTSGILDRYIRYLQTGNLCILDSYIRYLHTGTIGILERYIRSLQTSISGILGSLKGHSLYKTGYKYNIRLVEEKSMYTIIYEHQK